MIELDILLSSVLERAIEALKKARADVYTFSFCHERVGAVAVYADDAANSRRVVRELNRASMKNFTKAVKKRDLDEALMWQAMVGRSLSPGDFAWKKLARRSLGKLKQAPSLHEAMLIAAMRYAPKVSALTSDPESLLFTCSTADDEVGLIWSAEGQSPARKSARAPKVAGRRSRDPTWPRASR
jgi:hypothetical protein